MHIDEEMTDEQMKDLALSYVDMISLICVKFAEYITYIDDEPESEATPEETQQDITPSDEADIEDFSTSDKY